VCSTWGGEGVKIRLAVSLAKGDSKVSISTGSADIARSLQSIESAVNRPFGVVRPLKEVLTSDRLVLGDPVVDLARARGEVIERPIGGSVGHDLMGVDRRNLRQNLTTVFSSASGVCIRCRRCSSEFPHSY